MMNPFHKLKIASDAMSRCAVLEIDGKPVKGVQAISIELRSDNFAVVKIELHAEVDAEVDMLKWDMAPK